MVKRLLMTTAKGNIAPQHTKKRGIFFKAIALRSEVDVTLAHIHAGELSSFPWLEAFKLLTAHFSGYDKYNILTMHYTLFYNVLFKIHFILLTGL